MQRTILPAAHACRVPCSGYRKSSRKPRWRQAGPITGCSTNSRKTPKKLAKAVYRVTFEQGRDGTQPELVADLAELWRRQEAAADRNYHSRGERAFEAGDTGSDGARRIRFALVLSEMSLSGATTAWNRWSAGCRPEAGDVHHRQQRQSTFGELSQNSEAMLGLVEDLRNKVIGDIPRWR